MSNGHEYIKNSPFEVMEMTKLKWERVSNNNFPISIKRERKRVTKFRTIAYIAKHPIEILFVCLNLSNGE